MQTFTKVIITSARHLIFYRKMTMVLIVIAAYCFQWAIHDLFFIYFRFFPRNSTIFTSSIQCWDLNPQPLERESSPLTTIPGLPPHNLLLLTKLSEALRSLAVPRTTIDAVRQVGMRVNIVFYVFNCNSLPLELIRYTLLLSKSFSSNH